MKYIYKITGKVSLILYIFMLYQFWHLCQYGGLRRHIPMLALGIIGLVGTVVLWLISKRHNQEVNSGDNGNKKLFYTEMILLIAATLFFGGRIVYSAVPYHGALSWKLDEWMRKKEVELEHNNLFEDGVEGILMDLDEALQLPEELYIANKYQVSFDENGTIQRIYAFIYGKNEAGEKKTYLIDYDADSSNDMTVWIDGNVNGEYSDDMRLSPMIEILNNSDWTSQVEAWAETFEEQQIYEILYMGRRSFSSEEGLQYISGDADGDGTETGTGNFTSYSAVSSSTPIPGIAQDLLQLTPPLPPTIILRSILSFPTAFTRSACRLIGSSTGISAKLSATCFPALCSPHLTADWMLLSSSIQIKLTAAYRNNGTQSTASTVTEADTDAFSLTQDMAIKSGRKSNPSSFLRISNMCL